MKGDFTRSTFDRRNHYNSVRMQQGRVQLDADWNEQHDLTQYRIETETVDTIGGCGGPIHAAGFHLVAAVTDLSADEQARPENQDPPALNGAGDVYISGGRYYVEGLLVENEAIVPFSEQPDLPVDPAEAPVLNDMADPPAVPADAGTYLAYLDVWERHLTALEAPSIREVALGGPDTATRTQAVWQVKLHALTPAEATAADCVSDIASWDDLTAPGTGQIGARAEEAESSDDPCIVTPGAGFRRLENQLYRVEVHGGGARNTATFKWSRDNGAVVARLEAQDVDFDEWTVSSLGRDQVLRFASGQWVELIDDTHERLGVPGTLAQVRTAEGTVVTIDPTTATGPIDAAQFPENPRVRRWDGLIENVTNQNFIALEDGVQVRLRAGTYRTGDYWQIPARTATGAIEWPLDGTDPAWQLPHGVRHRYCRLALMTFDGAAWTSITDCRTLFPPVTELTSLFYVGGDGQEARPDLSQPSQRILLAQPLQVGVANGQHPVAGATIRFEITDGNGQIDGQAGPVEVATDADGLASCPWAVDATTQHQAVQATLLDPAGNARHLPIRFNAHLSVAAEVAYTPADDCALPATVTTVQEALDALCRREGEGCAITIGPGPDWEARARAVIEAETDFHLCFQAGTYQLTEPLRVENKGHVTLSGCGTATRFVAPDAEAVFVFNTCTHVTLRNFYAEAGRAATTDLNGVLTAISCRQVTVDSVTLQCAGGPQRQATCITVRGQGRSADGAFAPQSTRIRHCDLQIGYRQTGILVVDATRAQIEDNTLQVTERPAALAPRAMLRLDARFRAAMQWRLVRLAESTLPGPRVTITAGGRRLVFSTVDVLANAWQPLVNAVPPQRIETQEDLVHYVLDLADRLLQGSIDVPEAAPFNNWITSAVAPSPSVASQGIVVGGTNAPDVRILNNTVRGVWQGIHLGVSHEESDPGPPDQAGAVSILGNVVEVLLSIETTGERHGIFAGNVQRLLIENNDVQVRRAGNDALDIDGVRVFGVLGPRLLILQNYLENVTTGVLVRPLTPRPEILRWLVADNVAPGALAVDAPDIVDRRDNVS